MPTFKSSTTGYAAATSVSCTAPAGVVAGDFQVLVLTISTGSETATTPSGWTLMGESENTGSNTSHTYFWYSTTATGSVSISKSSTRGGQAIRAAYADHDGYVASSWSATQYTTAGGTTATPSKTVTAVGQMVIGFSLFDGSGETTVLATATPPAGWTERVDVNSGTPERMGLQLIDITPAATGAVTGTTTWNNTAAIGRTSAAFILDAPTPSGGGLFLPF
jgi:hypothetical protein